jgi:hypothetical protein
MTTMAVQPLRDRVKVVRHGLVGRLETCNKRVEGIRLLVDGVLELLDLLLQAISLEEH